MKSNILIAIALLIAVAAAAFAWNRNQALEATTAELAATSSKLQQAEARIKPLEASVETLRAESAAQQKSLEQLKTEVANAKVFLEVERESGLRLRDELAKTREAFALAMKARGPQAASPMQLPPGMIPMLVRPQMPLRVERAPTSGAALEAASPARAAPAPAPR